MTAIEYLVQRLAENGILHSSDIANAKELEKQQIIEAAYFGHLKGWVDDGFENSYGEHYYYETFKSE